MEGKKKDTVYNISATKQTARLSKVAHSTSTARYPFIVSGEEGKLGRLRQVIARRRSFPNAIDFV